MPNKDVDSWENSVRMDYPIERKAFRGKWFQTRSLDGEMRDYRLTSTHLVCARHGKIIPFTGGLDVFRFADQGQADGWIEYRVLLNGGKIYSVRELSYSEHGAIKDFSFRELTEFERKFLHEMEVTHCWCGAQTEKPKIP